MDSAPEVVGTGDALDRRLVQAAVKALEDTPADALSLRQVAQSLGVSHQAPYVHFGSKRRFLAAVAGAGLQSAADDAAAAVAASPDSLSRLHALTGAYLSFIRDRPHLHDLAYGPAIAKRDHPALQRAAAEYWSLLHDTVAACQPPGIAEEEVLRRSAATWGTVYGITRLVTFHQIPQSVPADADTLVHAAIDALFTGWQTQRITREPSDHNTPRTSPSPHNDEAVSP